MRKKFEMNKREQNLLQDALVQHRNGLLAEQKPTEDVSDLLTKVLVTPARKAEEKTDAER